jgi:hypothetical protein
LALKIPDKGTEKAGDLEERGSEPLEKPKREDMVVLQAAPQAVPAIKFRKLNKKKRNRNPVRDCGYHNNCS